MEVVTAVKKYKFFLNNEYELILGRKGKSKTIRIIFDEFSWFHVGGLHYLTDIDINQNRRSTEKFFDDIIEVRITEDYFKTSSNYNAIQDRLELLSRLDQIIEGLDNKLVSIYSFSKKSAKFYTTIDGDYLIVDLKTSNCNRQVLFPKFRHLIFPNPRHLRFHSQRHFIFHTCLYSWAAAQTAARIA